MIEVKMVEERMSDGSKVYGVEIRQAINGIHAGLPTDIVAIAAISAGHADAMANAIVAAIKVNAVETAKRTD